MDVGSPSVVFNPKLRKGEVINYRKFQLRSAKHRFITYDPDALVKDPNRAKEEVSEGDLADLLRSVLHHSDFIIVHSYRNESPKIDETDFLVLSKTHGLFHFELKGYRTAAKRTIPVCPRGAILSAWDQLNNRSVGLRALLKQDVLDVPQYGVTEEMVDKLIDRLELKNRACIVPQVDDQTDLKTPCGKGECKFCSKRDLHIGDSHVRILGPKGKLEDNLRVFIRETHKRSDWLFKSPFEQRKMFLFLIRRFVVMRHQHIVPTPEGLILGAQMMDERMDKYTDELAKLVAKGTVKTLLLSLDQQELLSQCGTHFIAGPAGSGKTVVLLLKAEQLIRESFDSRHSDPNQLLIVCFTRGITNHIRKCLKAFYTQLKLKYAEKDVQMPDFEQFATVATYDGFLVNYCGATYYPPGATVKDKTDAMDYIIENLENDPPPLLYTFTHILLDECQNFFGNWMDLFELFQTPFDYYYKPQCLWSFYDSNQDMWVNRYENELKGVRPDVELNQVFRSTTNMHKFAGIFVKVLESWSKSNARSNVLSWSDVKMAHTINGYGVFIDDCVVASDYKSDLSPLEQNAAASHIYETLMGMKLSDVVEEMGTNKRKHTGKSDMYPKDTLDNIAVLVRNRKWADQITKLLIEGNREELREPLKVVKADGMAKVAPDEVRLDSVIRFSGLEARVIVWFEPNIPKLRSDCKHSYLAITRSTSTLVVITTKAMKDFVVNKEKPIGPSCINTSIPQPPRKKLKSRSADAVLSK